MRLTLEQLIFEIRDRFLLRWIVANVVGWTVGLYAGVLNPWCFAGAGIITGLILGGLQWWALRGTNLVQSDGEDARRKAQRWIGYTFAGAALGMLPAAMVGGVIYLFANGLAALLAGGVLGLAVGIGQWMILKRGSPVVTVWLLSNAAGGALCGLLTVMPIIRGLPLGMVVGAALFGYFTGRVLERIIQEHAAEHSPA